MRISEDETSYRKHVERYSDKKRANKLTSDDNEALDRDRAFLRLSPEQAERIQQEVWTQTPSPGSLVAPAISNPPPHPQLASLADASDEVPEPHEKEASEIPDHPQPGNAATFDPEETMIPAVPENYFAHRQQYGQEFLQAHQSEGFNLGDETRKRLRELATQLELSAGDVAEIEKNMLAERYFTSKPTDTPPPLDPKYDPDLQILFEQLEGQLKTPDFKLADLTTLNLLQKIIPLEQDWLDEESLRKFTPTTQDSNAVQEIDRLWYKYSDGNFGFSPQIQTYNFGAIPTDDKDLDKDRREHRLLALAFGRSTQWWIDGLEFFKYYNQLDFIAEAPKGHLPALWFWKIPRSKAFLYGGLGLRKERGGCRVDAYILPTFMYVLKKCGIKPR